MSLKLHEVLDQFVAALPASKAVVSPGSRNAAVIEALLSTGYELFSVVDERSAAFQALGMAKASGEPVALSCTSGTAALNYYPAIAEAFYAQIPLLVLTADRPAELIDQWEGQSIRQDKVFEKHCRLSLELNPYTADVKGLIFNVLECMNTQVPGPIHVNIPIREPFYDREVLLPAKAKLGSRKFAKVIYFEDLVQLRDDAKLMVVHGMKEGSNYRVDFKESANEEKAVILSDLSSDRNSNIQNWDALLYGLMRHGSSTERLKPNVLITTGTFNLSKGLKQFLRAQSTITHYHIGAHPEHGDPYATKPIWVDPLVVVNSEDWNLDDSFNADWMEISRLYSTQFEGLSWTDFHEFSAMRQILDEIPANAIVHSSNSMPVRYVSFLRDRLKTKKIYANRGTSGIDGCSSTAIGYALLTEEDVYLISGDIAFSYDSNAWFRDGIPKNVKVILLNNQGGQIFEFVDNANKLEARLDFQLTKHQRNFKLFCQHFGLKYFCAQNFTELDEGLSWLKQSNEASVLEIITQPQVNKEFYKEFKQLGHEQ